MDLLSQPENHRALHFQLDAAVGDRLLRGPHRFDRWVTETPNSLQDFPLPTGLDSSGFPGSGGFHVSTRLDVEACARFCKRAVVLAPTVTALAFFAAGATSVLAQTAEKLPSVQEVLERYVKATGGRDALLRHKSMTIHGYGEEPARNLRVEGVLYTKDGKMLQKITSASGKVDLSG
jgi:hypothetical protein